MPALSVTMVTAIRCPIMVIVGAEAAREVRLLALNCKQEDYESQGQQGSCDGRAGQYRDANSPGLGFFETPLCR